MLILLDKRFPLNVESDAVSALNEILSTEKYVRSAAELVDRYRSGASVDADEKFYSRNPTLFVYQGEVAVLPTEVKDQFKMIASDKATSCHIVIVRGKKDGKVGIGHFDNPFTVRSDMTVLTEHFGKEDVDVHIVGGYDDSETVTESYEVREDDDDDSSGKITANGLSISILQYFIKYFKGTATLKTFCANVLNDSKTYAATGNNNSRESAAVGPIVRGCGLETRSGELIPGRFKCYDLDDERCASTTTESPPPLDRFVPEVRRRSSYGFQITYSRRFENIVRTRENKAVCLVLNDARYKFASTSRKKLARADPVKDKDWILERYSTTPDVEDDDFATVMVDCAKQVTSAERDGNMDLPKVTYEWDCRACEWKFQSPDSVRKEENSTMHDDINGAKPFTLKKGYDSHDHVHGLQKKQKLNQKGDAALP